MKKLYEIVRNETYLILLAAALLTVLAFCIASNKLEFLANYFAGATTTAAIAWLIETADDEQEQGGTFHDEN